MSDYKKCNYYSCVEIEYEGETYVKVPVIVPGECIGCAFYSNHAGCYTFADQCGGSIFILKPQKDKGNNYEIK